MDERPHGQAPPRGRELLDLQGRTAIVTGAGMGIGEAIAERLHEAGAAVVVADVAEAGAEVARRLERRRPGSAFAVQADVADERDAERLVAATLERFRTLDVLINNAGVYPRVPFLEMEPAVFRRVLDVNLLGVFLCTRAAVRPMAAAGRGKIINITSIDAVHPSMVGLAHYDASKHGVWGFTKNIALELAPRAPSRPTRSSARRARAFIRATVAALEDVPADRRQDRAGLRLFARARAGRARWACRGWGSDERRGSGRAARHRGCRGRARARRRPSWPHGPPRARTARSASRPARPSNCRWPVA